MMMKVLSIEVFTVGIALLTVLEIFTSSRRNFIWGLLPMIPPFGGVLYGLIEHTGVLSIHFLCVMATIMVLGSTCPGSFC